MKLNLGNIAQSQSFLSFISYKSFFCFSKFLKFLWNKFSYLTVFHLKINILASFLKIRRFSKLCLKDFLEALQKAFSEVLTELFENVFDRFLEFQ